MSEEEKITGIITDWCMGWGLEVAEKLNIRRAIFWPASATLLCSLISISKLLGDGIIDNDASEWIVANSAYDLEPGALSFAPSILPIRPLLASNRLGDQMGYFWPEDSTCLKWLDQQPPNSVVYIGFGSFTLFDQTFKS
ncbi:unnamed protein product [Dovyalis caffra]|uniref:UDP-glycosyltransferase n=1 Tax=Dovyalis caffra TaxID=77055 RepID=A0AAV1QRP5_9ROSI|nr:unnamed protein product [Dovyalis caffra]